MNQDDASIGRLSKRYNDTVARIVELRRELSGQSTTVIALGYALRNPHTVKATREGQLYIQADGATIDPDLLHMLLANLVELHEALSDKTAMETCLDDAGLASLKK